MSIKCELVAAHVRSTSDRRNRDAFLRLIRARLTLPSCKTLNEKYSMPAYGFPSARRRHSRKVYETCLAESLLHQLTSPIPRQRQPGPRRCHTVLGKSGFHHDL